MNTAPELSYTPSAIFTAVSSIMSELEAIGKDKRNAQQGFNFRGIDDVYNKMNKLLAKHRVFTVPEVLEDRTEERQTKSGSNLIYRVLRIRYRFYAVDGSYVDAVVIGEGMDSGDKAANKAMSIAHKYALFQVFCIPTEDVVDPDAETHQVKPVKKDGPERPPVVTSQSKPAPAPAAPAPAVKQPVASKPTSRFAGLPGLIPEKEPYK